MEATGRPGSTIGRLGRRTTVLLAVVALVAACSNAGGGTSAPPATQPAGPSAAATTPAAAGITLELAQAPVGSYVAGKDGMALYVFLPDEGKDGSQCNGDCAASWPPLTVETIADVTAGDGVTGELGTITREDGTTQVTLGGAPLYYFSGDEAAGDVNGQDLNDVWYLASAEGQPVGDEDEPPAEKTPCGGRYCY